MFGQSRKFIPPTPKQQPKFNFGNLSNPAPPIEAPRPDFASRYNELIQDTPDRLAYREHVLSGPPTVERGKWAKLGAILAGAATGLGSGSASEGMNIGLSSYYEPERRAQEQWSTRGQGLGMLADMEAQDIQSKIKGLEMESDNYWRSRDDLRADRTLSHNIEQDRLTNTRADAALKLQGLTPIQETDGNTYLYDKQSGRKTLVGKTGFTTEEQMSQRAAELRQELSIKEPYEVKSDNRRAAQARETAEIAAGSRENVAAIRSQAQIEASRNRLATKANTMKPGDQGKQVLVDLIEAAASDRILSNIQIDKYIQQDPTTGLPTVTGPGFFGDDAEDIAIKNRIKQIIAGSIQRSKSIGGDTSTTTRPVVDDPLGLF